MVDKMIRVEMEREKHGMIKVYVGGRSDLVLGSVIGMVWKGG